MEKKKKGGLLKVQSHFVMTDDMFQSIYKSNEKIDYLCTYSVDSTTGDDGIIINIQFVRIVVMMNRENNG